MKPKLKILIVDDDQRMTHTLADILAVSGYAAVEASSAHQALERVREESFDCVLTDIRMPQMDGVAFNQAVSKEQPGLPVILMTAYAADDLIQQGLEEGIVGVLDKPINIVQLLGFFSILAKNRIVAIVDDDPILCEKLCEVLQSHRFTVDQRPTLQADMNKMISEAQVVLLGLKLNSSNGVDTLNRIRDQYPGLPVLLVTANCEEMAIAIAFAMENPDFTCLDKPTEVTELVRLLEQIHLNSLRRVFAKGW